ncbi:MAG: helix-turn-helix domain-containing protein [Oscillospiraceae bacterium]
MAAELRLAGRGSVQQAAAYVGYADNNYFSKVFKEHQGMSPQKYRKARGLSDRIGLRR